MIRQQTDLRIVRCRIKGRTMIVEVRANDRAVITANLLKEALFTAQQTEPQLIDIVLDDAPYRPGRAFVDPLLDTPL